MTLEQLQLLLAPFLAIYRPLFLTLVGLVAADVLLGIGAALKTGTFHWREVANFYRTNIMPKLIGWSALSILTYTVTQSGLPPEVAGFVFPITAGAAWSAVLIDLLASITSNARELFLPPAPPPVKPIDFENYEPNKATPYLPGGKVENRTNEPLAR